MQRRKTKKRTRTDAFDIYLGRVDLAWTVDAGMQHLYPHHVSSELQHAFSHEVSIKLKPGGYKKMSSIFADQIAPSYTSSNAGGGVAGSQPMISAEHIT
jgi:hypothetical protein